MKRIINSLRKTERESTFDIIPILLWSESVFYVSDKLDNTFDIVNLLT
jgi:uncharacterized membrane protein (GlpM family)